MVRDNAEDNTHHFHCRKSLAHHSHQSHRRPDALSASPEVVPGVHVCCQYTIRPEPFWKRCTAAHDPFEIRPLAAEPHKLERALREPGHELFATEQQ